MGSSETNLVDGGDGPAVRERGLRARPAPVPLCRHCGSPLAGAAPADGFCCAGCAYVHRLVHEHGLEAYYRIRDAVVPPVDPVVFAPRDFSWFTAEVAEAEVTGRIPEATVGVQGISCAGCVWLIEKLFHACPGALAIETDAPAGRMRLRWARGKFDAAGFARTLHGFNYLLGPATAAEPEPASRALLRRVGLCAAFTMNLMLFAFPRYFGMESASPYARLFDTLSLGLATLSLLVGGTYFVGRAVQALRHRALHIDLPIAVGIVGAYAGSVFGWVVGREEFIYFDFVGAFIFLMLVGRWAQLAAVERNRRRLLQGGGGPQPVAVETLAGRVMRPAEEVRFGDIYLLNPGASAPVESRLESAAGTFSTAWITGENAPLDLRAGAVVPAGAVALSRDGLRLRAAQGWSDSLLARLLRPAARHEYRHRTLERIVAGYLVAIIGVAALSGIAWWWITGDALHTGSIVVAVLVVSCPCAVGLAWPLADEIAAVAVRRAGVFVREADLWPRLGRIRHLVFDKTGTLTMENPVLQNPEAIAALEPEARAVLATLVAGSFHPVSQGLRAALLAGAQPDEPVAGAGEVQEVPGLGVVLVANGRRWALGRAGWCGQESPAPGSGDGMTEFTADGRVLARFRFADEARPGAAREIAALREQGFTVSILSGDQPARVRALAAALGVAPENVVGGATPDEKAAWVRAADRRDTMMLGDGANDTLAFAASFARGTPVVHRGLLEAQADFYYLGRGLEGLQRLFAVDARRRRTQLWLLVFSIAYNLAAVGLAVSGQVNPLVAAILMPISSFVSLAIVGSGLRSVQSEAGIVQR
jgi:Cu2+-exporting ATPase